MTAGFAERLRKLRADKGISQQLAVKMMVDRSSIARWEDGARSTGHHADAPSAGAPWMCSTC
ncbi:MAG: helix-turn-helix transcriptional regulator [Clostridia bacterium]|nr:helix-turn-helix transcriptional regulator [Clostridia bacterium]